MSTQPTPQGYYHNGEWFAVTYDTEGQQAIITYPAYPPVTGWVMMPPRAVESGPYTGLVNYGDHPRDSKAQDDFIRVTDAVDWVCDQLLILYASRADRTPVDKDATAETIRQWVASLPALSDPED